MPRTAKQSATALYVYCPKDGRAAAGLETGEKYPGTRQPQPATVVLETGDGTTVPVPEQDVLKVADTTEEQLRQAATHVAHEVRMLRAAWHRRSDALAYTAWFIHCRALMDFFEDREDGRPPKDGGNICASHFFTDRAMWCRVRDSTTPPEAYSRIRKAVNKLAAHLTYARLSFCGGEPSQEVTEYLLGQASAFVGALPEERRIWFGGMWP